MRIIINKDEIVSIKSYIKALNMLVENIAVEVEIDIDLDDMIETSDMEELNEALGEIGGSIVETSDFIVMEIPEEFTLLYMDLLAKLVSNIEPEIIDVTKIIMKYKDTLISGYNFIKNLGFFISPIREINEVLKRMIAKNELFDDLAISAMQVHSCTKKQES